MIFKAIASNNVMGEESNSNYFKNSKSVLNSLVNITMSSAIIQSKPLQFSLESTPKVSQSTNVNIPPVANKNIKFNCQKDMFDENYNPLIVKNGFTQNKNRYLKLYFVFKPMKIELFDCNAAKSHSTCFMGY